MNLITRYDPFTILKEFNTKWPFNNNEDSSLVEGSHFLPATDILEEKNQYIICADIPGINKDALCITMENNILTIKGERKEEKQFSSEQNDYVRQERTHGVFYRRFALPENASSEKIIASINNGVLKILVPKKESAKHRRIEIQEETM